VSQENVEVVRGIFEDFIAGKSELSAAKHRRREAS
jgi:hypothetical protein